MDKSKVARFLAQPVHMMIQTDQNTTTLAPKKQTTAQTQCNNKAAEITNLSRNNQ